MTAVPTWVYDILAPLLGVLICTVMFLSPIVVVRKAIKNNDLGDLNPLPWLAIVVNCFGWALYGCMRRDYFVFWSNFPGFVCGVYYVVSAIKILTTQQERPTSIRQLKVIEGIFYGAFIFWGIVGMIAALVLGESTTQRETAAFLVGIICCVAAVTYYIAPLVAMFQIIRSRDSSSLYPPTLIANLLNATLWSIYGYAIHDPLIWVPNSISLVLSIVQVILCALFWPYDLKQLIKYKDSLLGNTPRSVSDDKLESKLNDS